MKFIKLIALFLTVVSCSNNMKDVSATEAVDTSNSKNQEKIVPQNTDDSHPISPEILYSVEKIHYFSSKSSPDTFRISLSGENINDGQIAFTIKSKANQIFEKTFPSRALIGYEFIDEEPSVTEKVNHIKQRMDKFFDEENFFQPAIGENEKYDELDNSMITKDHWERIKNTPVSIGFSFFIWEESIEVIVFSPEKQKAITFRTCC